MSHAVVVKAARKFAACGFPVFRFDFSGCGDSEGDLSNVSLTDWQQDLGLALDAFHQEAGITQCFLWGLRLGAGLALLHSPGKSENIAGLILWQPVLDFSLHIKQFLRQAISTQISRKNDGSSVPVPEKDILNSGLTHVIGYPITQHLFESFYNIDKLPADVISTKPTFLLSLSMMEQANFAMKKYAEHLSKESAPVVLQHITTEPFWDRYWQWESKSATEATLDWLKSAML